MRIKQIAKISTGTRLKELIQESYPSNKAFLEVFNSWLDKNNKNKRYINSKNPELTPKDLSRWVNNRVEMEERKKQMFADFFNVDVEYLQCTQIEKTRSDYSKFNINPEEIKQIQEKYEAIDYLIKFLNMHGFDIMEDTYKTDKDVIQFIDNNVIYEMETTERTDILTYKVLYPNGDLIIVPASDIDSFMKSIVDYIDFSLQKLRNNNSQSNG